MPSDHSESSYLYGLADGISLCIEATYNLALKNGYVSGYVDSSENRKPIVEFKEDIAPQLPKHHKEDQPARGSLPGMPKRRLPGVLPLRR